MFKIDFNLILTPRSEKTLQQFREGFKRDDTVTPAQVADAIGESPEDVENILHYMASKGRVVRRAPENEGGFKMD